MHHPILLYQWCSIWYGLTICLRTNKQWTQLPHRIHIKVNRTLCMFDCLSHWLLDATGTWSQASDLNWRKSRSSWTISRPGRPRIPATRTKSPNSSNSRGTPCSSNLNTAFSATFKSTVFYSVIRKFCSTVSQKLIYFITLSGFTRAILILRRTTKAL